MSIKKIISALLVLPVLAAASCVCAEDERFAISALKAHTMERWEETYQAYGRTIDVNVPIQVPETDCVQVYIVEPMPLLSEEKQDEIKRPMSSPKTAACGMSLETKNIKRLWCMHICLAANRKTQHNRQANYCNMRSIRHTQRITICLYKVHCKLRKVKSKRFMQTSIFHCEISSCTAASIKKDL